MGKYIYLYRGSSAELSELTPEQGEERMDAFRAWMTRVGTALVDVGCPFGTSTSVRADNTEAAASSFIGYSIVEAADLEDAKIKTEGLPLLNGGDGNHAVEIFELLSM